MEIQDSERLSFHYITHADADFLWEVDQDERVMRYINGGKKTTREEIHDIFVPRFQAYSNPALGWGLWRVREKQTEQDIGWVLARPFGFFTHTPEIDNIELGWRFKFASWGKGYAFEAANSVKDALYLTGTDKFCAITNPENKRSIRVMEKLGMTFSHELEYKDYIYHETVVVYST